TAPRVRRYLLFVSLHRRTTGCSRYEDAWQSSFQARCEMRTVRVPPLSIPRVGVMHLSAPRRRRAALRLNEGPPVLLQGRCPTSFASSICLSVFLGDTCGLYRNSRRLHRTRLPPC